MHSTVVYHLVPADRTLTNIHAIKQEHKVCYSFPLCWVSRINGSTEPMDMFQCFCFPAIREISAEPDPVEALWQHMLQEKPNKFFTRYRFYFLFVAVGIIRVSERNFIFGNAFDTAVADCRTISIAGKVFHGITISVKSFFYKGTPFF